jgi:hypothetical protein
VLAGCASTPAAAPRAPTTHAAAAAAQYASNTPPPAARMICSDEIRREIAGALAVATVPAPQSAWAGHVYTCTYPLPSGRLVLSVAVAPSASAAQDRLESMRTRAGTTHPEPGLGERAYGTETGTVMAVKDNMTLRVDATALPDDLGATHERRTDLARVIARGVFNCWTGTS